MDIKVKIKAKKAYRDLELDIDVAKDNEYEVTFERAKEIVNKGYAILVDVILENAVEDNEKADVIPEEDISKLEADVNLEEDSNAEEKDDNIEQVDNNPEAEPKKTRKNGKK